MISKILISAFAVLLFSSLPVFAQTEMKTVSINLSAAGELLIIAPDGKRTGFDAVSKKTFTEIEGATGSTSRDRQPVYKIPVADASKNLTIRVWGKTAKSRADLGITGENFTIRLVGLSLDARKNFTVAVRLDGGKIEFSSNTAGDSPSISFAADPADAEKPSYIFKLNRSKLAAKKIVTAILDLSGATFIFTDNAAPPAIYGLNARRINADGAESVYANEKITSRGKNRFQFDFKNWNQKDGFCLQVDGKGSGFDGKNCLK